MSADREHRDPLWHWGTTSQGTIAITVCEGDRPVLHLTDRDLARMFGALHVSKAASAGEEIIARTSRLPESSQ